MNIVVLVKHALVIELRPSIRVDGKDFENQELVYEMNDWDRYALEEAIRIKEQKGAKVLAISVGNNCDRSLRMCLALGVDSATKIPFDSRDSLQIAEVISEIVKAEQFDLILAGFQSQDLNNALVGPILAGMLDLPYATAVTSVTFEDNRVRIRRELEAGVEQEDILPLPCLLTVQTGINQPRYVPFRSIERAKSKVVKEISVIPKSSTFEIKKLYFPPIKRGKTIEGSSEEVSTKLIQILKDRGLL